MLLTILKDPFVYSMCFYIISAFSLPIHIFGGYCILYKTPVIMKSVKWALFNLHFWSAALDISISLFVQPYQCTPALAGFSMGLWGWMGVPPPIWTLIHFVIFRLVPVSIISMFENRYFVLFVEKGGPWRYLRYPFLILNYTLSLAFCIPVHLEVPPDQEKARRMLFEMYPQACDSITDKSLISVANFGNSGWTNIRENSLTCFVLLEIIFFVVLIRVKMNRALKNIRSSLSLNTLETQKKFIRALKLQIAIPILIIFLPATIAAVLAMQSSSQQEVHNLITLLISLHGVSATILMIYLQKPYREEFLKTICCRKPAEGEIFKVFSAVLAIKVWKKGVVGNQAL
ncbi:Serpentine Receptor, class H [Caenorhabditis elegans]|uniref:Serpentine Receptor, class H n=1 Tax=Caenorhabditis elegans TaxID=6239 RepID=Q9GRU8_CAEEL|nr:Serpentine Receptor, class H [Caenorhabditis elegans]CAC15865.2 Serpentine Receptor, class H [Caenorhabditis elegans]|eukprot:NP_507500.2 Serpentine Receptor, class H [Caenorhabditis elegans]